MGSKKATRDDLPPCLKSMGCLCAGHARGDASDSPCDTDETPRRPSVGDHLIVTRAGAKRYRHGLPGAVATVKISTRAGGKDRLTVEVMGKLKSEPWPTKNLIAKQQGVCCSKCGGMNVEYSTWYNPNTGETGDIFGSWNAGDNTYCCDCGENTDLIDGSADPEEFLAARAKHGKCRCDGDNCGETPCVSEGE